jgi:hypothetical protein
MITWEYLQGEGYYLSTEGSAVDAMLTAMVESGIPLPLPRTAENDADLQALVVILERLASRREREHGVTSL